MNTVPPIIIVLRYAVVAVLIYFIWIGNLTAIKIFCTIVIFHSECLYIANRLKEKQAYNLLNKLKERDKDVKK